MSKKLNLIELRKLKERYLYFSLSLIITFLFVRIFIWIFPTSFFNLGSYNIHHLFLGIILLIIAIIFLVSGRINLPILFTAGCGSALILDEFLYLIITNGTRQDYLQSSSVWQSIITILMTLFLILIIYYFEKNWRK